MHQISRIRSTVLVDGRVAHCKVDVGRDGPICEFRNRDRAQSGANDVPVDVLKEPERLRGQPVCPACPAVEPVEFNEGGAIVGVGNIDSFTNRLSNVAFCA